VTCTVLRVRTLPTPPQSTHWLPRGMVVPVPEQRLQVLAIWNPLSMTNVRVPDPPQSPHVDLFEPALRPLPEQALQSTTGEMLTLRVVPLHASRKFTVTVASRSAPRDDSAKPASRVRPPKAPNNCSNKSPWDRPAPAPKIWLKSWNPPPAVPAPNGPRAFANASGSKPGCCDAGPYLS
jgi:hypothetical protein